MRHRLGGWECDEGSQVVRKGKDTRKKGGGRKEGKEKGRGGWLLERERGVVVTHGEGGGDR